MKRSLVLAGLLTLLLPMPTFAASGFYLGAHGGLSIVQGTKNESREGSFNFEFDPGYTALVAVGYNLRDRYPQIGVGRVELEAGYRSNDIDKFEDRDVAVPVQGSIKVQSLMLNTFGEHRRTAPWIPYVGAGIGVARIELERFRFGDTLIVDDRDTVLAWQAGAGLGLELGRHFALDLGYRFFAAVDPRFHDAAGVPFKSEYHQHQALLGMRLEF